MLKLQEHNQRKITQFCRIKDIRKTVNDPERNAAPMPIDWMENAKLFQTQQEISDHYKVIQVSINTVIVYEADSIVTSHATISNYTWPSLLGILRVETLGSSSDLIHNKQQPNQST